MTVVPKHGYEILRDESGKWYIVDEDGDDIAGPFKLREKAVKWLQVYKMGFERGRQGITEAIEGVMQALSVVESVGPSQQFRLDDAHAILLSAAKVAGIGEHLK